MRVLIVSQYFWPENFRINDLAREFQERGHAVMVLTGLPNYPSGRLFKGYGYRGPWKQSYEGVRVIRAPLISRGGGGNLRLALNYLSFAVMASIIGLLRCRKDYDVIFVYEPSPITVAIPAIVLKWLSGAPLMLWVLDLWPESVAAAGAVRSKALLWFIERLVRSIYRQCDHILVQSQAFRGHIERLGIVSSVIHYFPSWAESLYTSMNGQAALPENVRLPAGFRIMFAGNVGAAQDFETIIKAAEQLKRRSDIHWIVLGDGRKFAWVREEIRRRQLESQMHLLGRYPLEAMPAFFAHADVMLVTLRRDPIFALTIPGKVQSYLACGRPVLAALDGEGARIIEAAGAGNTCPSENPEALAAAVLELAEISKETRERMGKQGADYYHVHFDRKVLLDKLEGWMHDLVRTGC